MQITEQIIQRIARQVFNQMFPSSLRQSGAVISGSGSSVQYAAEAGHAATADSATSAGSANSVAWSNVSSRPTKLSDFTNDVVSASVSGSTLTVNIGGTSYRLTDTNTWRPVVDNLTSTDTDKSLSANQGKVLKGYTDTLFGYFDASGNAKSALKLTTVSKTAWGQTYWTSGGVPDSISGNMSNVGNISFAATGKNIGSIAYFDTTNSRLGVGTSSPSDKLHVAGLVKITNSGRTLTIGALHASAIHIYNDNNSTTFVNGGFSSCGDTSYDLGSASYRWGTVYANRLIAYSTTDAEAGAANAVALITGTPQGYHLEMDSNEIMAKSDGTHSSSLYLNAEGGNVVINETSGNCGIGTSSPQYKLHVAGTIYATGSITEQSDIRNKDVESYAWAPALSVIADAPIAIYTMKDDKEQRRRVGSIAQYWQKAMPEAVCEAADGTLSMNYGEISLVSVIALAREVRQLKAQIEMLKRK